MGLKLTESGCAALLNYGLRTQVDIQLHRGRYKIKAVARDSVDARLGSVERTLEVPPLGAGSKLRGDSSWASAADATALPSQASLDFGFSYFYDSPDRARIPISAKLEGGAFQRKPSRRPTCLHFVGAAYAEDESVVAMFGETLNMAGNNRDMDYRNSVKLCPGSYRFELVVSDDRGTLGVAQRDLVVPAMSDALSSSSLVVGQQFIPLPEQIQNLQRTLVHETGPLIYKNFRVMALVEPQIQLDRPLAVFYKLYNLADVESEGKLKARVQLISERGEVNRFPLVDLDRSLETTAEGEVAVFLGFQLPTGEFAPGRYRLVVKITESSTERTVTGEASVLLQ